MGLEREKKGRGLRCRPEERWTEAKKKKIIKSPRVFEEVVGTVVELRVEKLPFA